MTFVTDTTARNPRYWWRMGEPSSTGANSGSAGTANLTFAGTVTRDVAGGLAGAQDDGAASFDGTSGRATASITYSGAAITLHMRVRLDEAHNSTDDALLLESGAPFFSATNSFIVNLHPSDGGPFAGMIGVGFQAAAGGPSQCFGVFSQDDLPADSDFHSLGIVLNTAATAASGERIRVFVDGVEVDVTFTTAGPTTINPFNQASAQTLGLAHRSSNNSLFAAATIDEFTIDQAALTPTNFSDLHAAAEAGGTSHEQGIDDELAVADAVEIDGAFATQVDDMLTASDALARSVTLALADTVELSDPGLAQDVTLGLDDTLEAGDAVDAGVPPVGELPLSETLSASDALARRVGLVLADSVEIGDAQSKRATTGVADAIEIADAPTRAASLGLSDSIAAADARAAAIGVTADDEIAVDDDPSTAASGTLTLQIADSLSAGDQFAREWAAVRAISEFVHIADHVDDGRGAAYVDYGGPLHLAIDPVRRALALDPVGHALVVDDRPTSLEVDP